MVENYFRWGTGCPPTREEFLMAEPSDTFGTRLKLSQCCIGDANLVAGLKLIIKSFCQYGD